MLRVSTSACKQKDGNTPWRLAKSEVVKLICPSCKAKGRFRYHGSYTRNSTECANNTIKDSKVKIERLCCDSCDTTHAVVPFELVPYLMYSLRFILNLMRDWAYGFFCSIEKLCAAYKISVNTFYRLKRRFTHHLVLLLGVCTSEDAMRTWLDHVFVLATFELDQICAGFLKRCGITLFEPRRTNRSKCAKGP